MKYSVVFLVNGFWIRSEPIYTIAQAYALQEYIEDNTDPHKFTGGHLQIELPDGTWIPEDEYESAQIIARRQERD